ncbi:gliding motility lipoprotein GldH [Dyadobacter sp. 3J3]|uniref:gliding motility lipoprotein GldH n=1 Tax=Dyadobacter sp. 3J3 TaxID=2606600 RepID=UPI001358A656|nr:gliding motility lipoprotein GldH [Dyadobacter sp. 3J3]
MKTFGLVATLCFTILLTSCDKNVVYKAYEDIDDGQWFIKNTPSFKVEIKDSMQLYNVFYLVRNTLQYPYYNLYLTRKITGPDNTLMSTTLQEVFISNEITGKPFGKGLGDLFDHKIPFLTNYKFPRSGTYTFTLSQSMRQNPLPFVMGIGISVEKAEK